MPKSKIAVMVSGEGTTAEAVIVASAEGHVNFTVDLVISSNEKAGIFKRIENLNQKYGLNIKCVLAANDNEVQILLEKCKPDLIVLMGYMKKIGPELVRRFGWQDDYTNAHQTMMLNTHPGLLPATKGLYGIHVQKYVIENKLRTTGQTLHIVSENYDEGPVIAEHKVSTKPDDTPETLFERVKIIEKKYLPADIENFIEKRKKYLESQSG
jgi:phosphoribosylglycinamide formyltransferase-1